MRRSRSGLFRERSDITPLAADIALEYQGWTAILNLHFHISPAYADETGINIGSRLKRSKAKNLLKRLQRFEQDVPRFMVEQIVLFTNNQDENDLRMTKVQQKTSSCFRSMEGAKIFFRVCSYLSTYRKNSVDATEALSLLFQGKSPKFMAPEEA